MNPLLLSLSQSITLYVLVILGVIALLTLVFLLFQIGQKIRSHLETQQTQQERINQSTVANFENINKIIGPITEFVVYAKKHIISSMDDSRQLRQYAMDHQLQMTKITEMYETSIHKIETVEEKVSVIDEKVNKIVLDCKQRYNHKAV